MLRKRSRGGTPIAKPWRRHSQTPLFFFKLNWYLIRAGKSVDNYNGMCLPSCYNNSFYNSEKRQCSIDYFSLLIPEMLFGFVLQLSHRPIGLYSKLAAKHRKLMFPCAP